MRPSPTATKIPSPFASSSVSGHAQLLETAQQPEVIGVQVGWSGCACMCGCLLAQWHSRASVMSRVIHKRDLSGLVDRARAPPASTCATVPVMGDSFVLRSATHQLWLSEAWKHFLSMQTVESPFPCRLEVLSRGAFLHFLHRWKIGQWHRSKDGYILVIGFFVHWEHSLNYTGVDEVWPHLSDFWFARGLSGWPILTISIRNDVIQTN